METGRLKTQCIKIRGTLGIVAAQVQARPRPRRTEGPTRCVDSRRTAVTRGAGHSQRCDTRAELWRRKEGPGLCATLGAQQTSGGALPGHQAAGAGSEGDPRAPAAGSAWAAHSDGALGLDDTWLSPLSPQPLRPRGQTHLLRRPVYLKLDTRAGAWSVLALVTTSTDWRV